MKLKEIAHARTGDKGEISNISVIPYDENDFDFLKEQVTAEKVKEYFSDICKGQVIRYEVEGVKAFNFFLDKTLGGGVTRSLAIDKHGKSLGMALLDMEIEDREKKMPLVNPDKAEDLAKVLQGRTIRIGSGAGYAGDRVDPAMELMEKGELDYIIFECLAERTIALGQKERQKDANLGYNTLLEDRMKEILPRAAKYGVKVITNMGSANPKSAAEVTVKLAGELGVEGLKIAYVTGDDIYDKMDAYQENQILENGQILKDFAGDIVSANTYIGADGIVEALNAGADIVITGRVSDPALVVGPLVHEFGWNVEENADQMGQAILTGHLLECAGQVTGGYFADPGYKDVPELWHLGFPIIQISETGSLVVTKVEGSGGMVTEDTCKEQMIYEIHNPKAYMTPDAIADFSQVRFTQIGKDQVLAEGATSHGRPETLKVSMGYKDCYIAEGEISYGGSGCLERAQLARDIIEKRLEYLDIVPDEFRADYIGLNSLYRDQISGMMKQGDMVETRLRLAARYTDYDKARRFVNDIEALYTNGPAGGGGATKNITEIMSVASIFVPREDIQITYHLEG